MKDKKSLTKVISFILIGVLILGIGGIVMATDNGKTSTTPATTQQGGPMNGHGMGKGMMKGTQPMDQTALADKLAQYVKQGVINQAQADKIAAYMKEKAAAMKAEMEKIQKMTEEQRKAYFEANKNTRPDCKAEIVKAGIITQAQADKMTDIFAGKGMRGPKKGFDQTIASLAEQGTITQDQANKLYDLMAKQLDAKKAELEKLKTMTAEQRNTYFAQRTNQRTDILTEAVKAGILTQAKADEIAKLMPQKGAGRGCHGGGQCGSGSQQQTAPAQAN